MKMKSLLLAVISIFVSYSSSARASPDCAALNAQVDNWQAYLEKYGSPSLKSPAGILAYGNKVTNGNKRLVRAFHKTDVSTIFVINPSGDFIRVVTTVPDGVAGSRQPAVGTTLTRNGPAWNALTNGESYCGTVTLFGNDFDSVYRPIFNLGVVIGALYVGNVPQ